METQNPVFTEDDVSEEENLIYQHSFDKNEFNEKTPFIEDDSSKNVYGQTTSWYLYFLVVFAAIGGFLFGYDTGVISGAMIPIKRQFHLSNEYQEIVVSITLVGAIVSAASSAYLNDKIGRRGVLFLASLSFTIGSLVMGLAMTVSMIIVGRLIVGFGIGYASMTVPIYIAEAAPSNIRGMLVTTNQLMITFGIFTAALLNSLFSYLQSSGWRFMLGIGTVPGVIMLIGVIFLPESPRWLISKGKTDRAKAVLLRLRGITNVDEEFDHIVSAVTNSTNESFKETVKRCLSSRNVKRAILLGCSLQAFQQLSAINTVMYYSATIIEMAGIENETEILWMATLVAFGNFITTVFTMYFVDKIKRRKLLLISMFGAAAGLLLLATTFILAYKNSIKVNFSPPSVIYAGTKCRTYDRCFTCVEDSKCGFCFIERDGNFSLGSCLPGNSTQEGDIFRPNACSKQAFTGGKGVNTTSEPSWSTVTCPSTAAWLAVTGMVFYLAMFAIGVGPLPWAINAEMYPLWARNVGQATATSTNWLFNLIVALTFLNLIELFTKPGVFIFYAVITFIGCIHFYLLLPETKGVKLEDVEKLYDGSIWVPWKRT